MTNSLDKNPFVNIEAEIEASFKDEKLKKELKHHAYILTKSEQEAEDLVQEARHNVWRSRGKIDWKNPKAFLMTIIKNLFINQYRKNQNRPTTNINTNEQREKITKDLGQNNTESSFTVQEIQEETNKLKEKLKSPRELYVQEYKYEEIAELLNIPLGTIKSRIFFAKKELAKALINKDSSYKNFVTKKL